MGYEYGRKVHAVIDTDSLSIMEWKITTASVYDKNMAFPMIGSVRNYNYILMDAAYDSSDIYIYIFENTHAIVISPIIGFNFSFSFIKAISGSLPSRPFFTCLQELLLPFIK